MLLQQEDKLKLLVHKKRVKDQISGKRKVSRMVSLIPERGGNVCTYSALGSVDTKTFAQASCNAIPNPVMA